MDQQQLCNSMMDEKNKIINEFKAELKQKDDLFVKTLKRYADDIDLLIERMKDQLFNMRKFYLEELNNVEVRAEKLLKIVKFVN
jgi:dynein regulatory complex protein 1